jgi:hypothetical protein
VDRALWAALRALEERASVLRRLARRAPGTARHFEDRAAVLEQHAGVLKTLLLDQSTDTEAETAEIT